ncbi:MAG: TonB-dependent receptor, partial [Saprospiraceae bacterium]
VGTRLRLQISPCLKQNSPAFASALKFKHALSQNFSLQTTDNRPAMTPEQRPVVLLACVFFLLCAVLPRGAAQGVLNRHLDFEVRSQPLGQALLDLSRASGATLGFSESMFEQPILVSVSAANEPLSAILDRLLEGSGLGWRESEGQILLFKKPPPTLPLSGFVEDADTGERLAGAVVVNLGTGEAVMANGYGFFSLRVRAGQTARLAANFLGYEKTVVERTPGTTASLPLVFALKPRADLPEVVVSGDSVAHDRLGLFATGRGDNLARLPLDRLPALGGEPDLMQGAAMLTGVGTSADGIGGWSVRGGDVDQNWLIMDDALVFSPGHGLGLFSVFVPGAVRDARLWKGDPPARLGGSAGSVLEVRTREGNMYRPAASAAVGWLAGRFVLEAPIKREQGAVLFSARTSFLGPFFRKMSRVEKQGDDDTTGESDYGFSDLHLKANWAFGSRDRLYLSLFSSSDHLTDSLLSRFPSFEPDIPNSDILATTDAAWQNRFASLRWNHIFADNCFANSTFTASRFDLSNLNRHAFRFEGNPYDFALQKISQTRLRDYSAKTDLDWQINERLALRTGVQASLTQVLPFFYQQTADYQPVEWVDYTENDSTPAPAEALAYDEVFTLALHGEARFSPVPGLRLQAGLRLEAFSAKGDTWLAPQPRLLVEKQWNGRLRTWATASWLAQGLRTVSPGGVESLGDIWLLPGKGLSPQYTQQATLGTAWDGGKGWTLSLEFFSKSMQNVEEYVLNWDSLSGLPPEEIVIYQDGHRLWANEIKVGQGRAYGLELLAEKTTGKTTGWAALTLSHSERRFDSLNLGAWFPARFDRAFNLKVVVMHQFGPRLSASAVWSFAGGDAISSLLLYQNRKIRLHDLHRGDLNATRLGTGDFRQPDQLRLDVALHYRWKTGRFEQQISVGAYNLLGQPNRHFTYLLPIANPDGELEQTPVNGLPFLPHLTWSGRF